jgi:hypothetical protein
MDLNALYLSTRRISSRYANPDEVHVLSHAGMVSSVPTNKKSIEKSKVLFHSQMKQKHYIIDQLGLYEHPKLVLMGHSIGARMMLDCIHENTLLAIGLTPTIERMSITPRGKDLTPHFNSYIYGLSYYS